MGRDFDTVINELKDSEQSYQQKVRDLFKEMDADDNGTITWKEFKEHQRSTQVQSFFHILKLDPTRDPQRLFRMLSSSAEDDLTAPPSEDDRVFIDQFVQGCAEVKGDASRKQMMSLAKASRCYVRQSAIFMRYVEDCFEELYKLLTPTPSRTKYPLEERMNRMNVPMWPFKEDA